ncbi:MAG: hypothetical protein IPL21_13790 [Saprospirales bacterium]|nr:hypothetical protein [Saprospirales bacterium]
MMTITETKDFKTIAGLNANVQNLHARLHPEMFKPFNRIEMENALENFLSDSNCYCYIVKLDDVAIGCAVFFYQGSKRKHFIIQSGLYTLTKFQYLNNQKRSRKNANRKAEQLAQKTRLKN